MTHNKHRSISSWLSLICALLAAAPSVAQAAADGLAALDRDMTGPRAQILVLGTVHLSGMPAGFNPASLDGALDKLAAFQPDIITIESLPGEECDLAARNPARYGTHYCASTEAAKSATGLDVPAALAEVNRTLKTWPAQATPAQRRHLSALFLAANDRASAYAQWLQLPPGERHADAELDAALIEALHKIAARNDETYQIAARLAARLGLQRVHATDNHTGDNVDVADEQAFGRAMEAAWATAGAEWKDREKQKGILMQDRDLLPLYRYINDPVYLRMSAEVNVGAALRARSTDNYPQMWTAGWEIRNLRMVANIRETFRERPGARVLSIVGVSHKPWFDSWLGRLQGVDTVDTEAVLK